MTTYTLHLAKEARPGDPAALEEAEIVKDGFSWGAFFFTFLWFFFHRLWLVGIGVFLTLFALNLALDLLDVHPAARFLAQLLLQVLIGLEAGSLRRWTYERRGRPAVDVVTASRRDEAEARSFARWLQRPAAPRVPVSPPSPALRPLAGTEPVIGLFPDAERPR
ncbi:DUF2628 domain-containing protein [Microvirga thermotolerans]|uniref:DUF2628 domain-containing protein n=1 Tax=Microvirga thermotolerans TaxID=2651334 RepID=A0A5P9JT46_9HYPH|nr:DUF2628 domain-containing protein [Microvirga thermotolerans]QFU14948.1 DUF2628 domain-containing protein [Microvirga thermotolerans]